MMPGAGNADAGGDEARMLAFADGDAGAFEALYARHKGGIYRYFLRSLQDAGQAEELAQDVWASLIRARAGYRHEAMFSTWLYRLAHNRLIDHYRRSSLVAFTALETDDDANPANESALTSGAPGPEDVAHQRAATLRLVGLVEHLPPAQREAFLLQVEAGLSLDQIAAATGSNFEAVKSRLRYAFDKLREGMKDYL